MLGMLVRPLLRRMRRSRKPVGALLSTIATLGLCAFQFGDRNELNKMPFDQVQALVSNLAKARNLAKQGNIDLLVGQVESGKTVQIATWALTLTHMIMPSARSCARRPGGL
jgi:hypothetical protein